jgi:hypothetical protein
VCLIEPHKRLSSCRVRFSRIEGVTATRVGYTGGAAPHPTYRSIADHTEVARHRIAACAVGGWSAALHRSSIARLSAALASS